jgi:DNA-binding transcriptional MerR regulator
MNNPSLTATPGYRIGAISKLSGVAVSTLRNWEHRYQAFEPQKSKGRHRMYSTQDLERARLLHVLSLQGHSISHLAKLDLVQLKTLNLAPSPARSPNGFTSVVRVGVSDPTLLTRIDSSLFQMAWLQHHPGVQIHTFEISMNWSAGSALGSVETEAELLWLRLQNLQHEHVQALLALRKRSTTPVWLLYQYARSADYQSLKQGGIHLCREPLNAAELALELARELHTIVSEPRPSNTQPKGQNLAPRRRYSDATLAQVAQLSTNLLCECPKHVAELTSQLAAFEAYSQTCQGLEGLDVADRKLHQELLAISGQARALFEDALERIAAHEGIPLPPNTPTAAAG